MLTEDASGSAAKKMAPRSASPEQEVLINAIVRLADGDMAAFSQVYALSSGKLFAVCQMITNDRAASEDLLQEVFLKIWRKSPGYDPARARPMAWLCAIARNTAIDWYRARPKHLMMGEEVLSTVPSEAERVDDRIIRMEQETQALGLADEMAAAGDTDLKQIFFQGQTYAEAAAQQGIPLGTIKSRVRRAVHKIREQMSND